MLFKLVINHYCIVIYFVLYVYVLIGVCVWGGGGGYSYVYVNFCIHIDGNKSNPHISIFDENEVFGEIIMFLIPISIKCQWLVLKFGCNTTMSQNLDPIPRTSGLAEPYKNDKNRSSKHSDSSCLCEVLTRCHRYVP